MRRIKPFHDLSGIFFRLDSSNLPVALIQAVELMEVIILRAGVVTVLVRPFHGIHSFINPSFFATESGGGRSLTRVSPQFQSLHHILVPQRSDVRPCPVG